MEIDQPAKGVQKIRLRRLNFNKPQAAAPGAEAPLQDIIKKNLEPLKENIKKKRIAQSFFYQQNPPGVSPLVRNNRASVRQRLGKTVPLRRLNFSGTSTASVPPKMRQLQKQNRHYSAQMRLNRIREQNTGHPGHMGNNPQQKKAIRLRRSLPNTLFSNRPSNFTVQVRNNPNNPYSAGQPQRTKKFKMRLDPTVQREIRDLQLAYRSIPMVLDGMDLLVKETGIKLHERFGAY